MKLRTFQEECADKLGIPTLTGRIIADDMGLGKTVEGLEVDARLRKACHPLVKARRPLMTLIVAPRGTHEEPWASTIKEYLGKKACIIDRKNRAPFISAVKNERFEYYICHYESLRLMPELKQAVWFHIIADECHRIKNWKTQQSRALKALKTRFKTAMSGTPADDKPQDFWSSLNWVYPKEFGSYWKFVGRYCLIVEEQGRGGATFKKIVDVNSATIPELRKRIAHFYIRRLKEDVLQDLPNKYYTQYHIDLYPAQRKVYDQLQDDMLAWIGEHEDEPLSTPVVVAQLIRLQQAALGTLEWGEGPQGPKIRITEPSAKLDDMVERMEGNPGPFIVFSQSKSAIRMTCDRLTKEGLRVAEFTGDTPDAARQGLITGFQDGKYDIFAATIATGGEGITLTRSSTEFFLDRAWSPSRNRQAEDRAHRIGQKSAVQVIDMMARDTVDLRVRDLNIRKWSALRQILGDVK